MIRNGLQFVSTGYSAAGIRHIRNIYCRIVVFEYRQISVFFRRMSLILCVREKVLGIIPDVCLKSAVGIYDQIKLVFTCHVVGLQLVFDNNDQVLHWNDGAEIIKREMPLI